MVAQYVTDNWLLDKGSVRDRHRNLSNFYHQNWFWAHPALSSMDTEASMPGVKRPASVRLTTHLHLTAM
jgi:hypothetical protein